MPTSKFSEIMARKSNVQLLEITTQLAHDYQPEALTAAQTELANRNLSADAHAQAEAELRQTTQKKAKRANEPLEAYWKVVFVFFPFVFGFVTWFLPLLWKGKGQERKAQEAWRWLRYGILGWIVVVVVLVFLSRMF